MTLLPRGAWPILALLALAACGEEPAPPAPLDAGTAAKVAAARARTVIDASYEADPRVALLLQPCTQGGYYDRDTSDPVAILLDKLQFGSTDALHRAKEELGGMGELAAKEVTRLLNRNFGDPMGGAKVQNCIEVLGLMRTPSAHAPLIKALDHPRDTVRAASLRALAAGAARPEDFERLLAHIPVERTHMRERAAVALFTADPDRAAQVFLDWLEQGTNSDLWPFMANRLTDADPELLRARALELCDRVDPNVGLPLAGLALESGDPRPRALLDQYLASDNGAQRLPAVTALIRSGHVAGLAQLANEDPDAMIRQQVLVGLADEVDADAGPDKATLARFQAALDDVDTDVRKVALGTLLRWHDAGAQDRALALLGGSRLEIQEVVLVIREALAAQPDFAERVLAVLLEAEAKNEKLPLEKRLATLQAIGQVPSAEAAEYLFELGQAAEGKLQGMRAFRWLMLQASNTARPGRLRIASLLPGETAPERRLDMIWAVSSQRDATSVEFLEDFLAGDHDPYELLFAAERFAKSGQTTTAAPVLKRLTLRVEHPEVRRALECLMWRWY